MTVLDLNSFRKKRSEERLQPKVVKEIPVSISTDQNTAIQELSARWNNYSLQGKLNNLFCNDLKLPTANYLESVSDIVEVERNMKIRVAVMPSDFINTEDEEARNVAGRAALFKYGLVLISTPFMPTEEQARMFALLLYHKLTHTS